jgi:hypothetical protein
MPLDRYLTRHAEVEASLTQSLAGCWRYAVVIPAYDEAPDFLQALPAGDGLYIVIANRPDTDSATGWLNEILDQLEPPRWRNKHLTLHQHRGKNAHRDILLVDRCAAGAPLPAKQGVGLARKIGCDIACQLIASKQVASPWLGTTDADTHLPENYGEALQKLPEQAGACVFPFSHTPSSAPEWAVRCYELHMLHYVAGLRYAQSPYAWPTVGSCIALNSRAYAQAHGFPKRAGGEDFYLLNKLAKLGGVVHASAPILRPSGRLSQRVPFGTGPALQRYASLKSPAGVTSYHPDSFRLLRAALKALRLSAFGRSFALTDVAQQSRADADQLHSLWRQFRCEQAVEKARRNSRSTEQCERHLMTWFDAFKSLKWVHACREYQPDIPLFEALENADWITDSSIDLRHPGNAAIALQRQLANNQRHSL